MLEIMLLDMLGKYRKKWSEQYGKYLDEPFHDVSSNYSDAFIYSMQAVSHLETYLGQGNALDKHKKAVAKRRFKI